MIHLIKALPKETKPWSAGLQWFVWSIFAGLLPLWGTAMIFSLFQREYEIYDFAKNGEIVLYAASFVGGAMYSIRKDFFPSKNSLTIIFFIILAVCALVFGAIALNQIDQTSFREINKTLLMFISGIIILFTTLLCLFVVVVEANGGGFDMPAAQKEGEKNLEKQFDILKAKVDREGDHD